MGTKCGYRLRIGRSVGTRFGIPTKIPGLQALCPIYDLIPDPSISMAYISPANRPKLDIPDQAIREACKVPERKSDPNDEDDLILDAVWFFFHRALSQYPELNRAIANKEELVANVKCQGEKSLSSY
jgi:hypothetical protein